MRAALRYGANGGLQRAIASQTCVGQGAACGSSAGSADDVTGGYTPNRERR